MAANIILQALLIRTNMAQLIKRYEVKLKEHQARTLDKLRDYNILPSNLYGLQLKKN